MSKEIGLFKIISKEVFIFLFVFWTFFSYYEQGSILFGYFLLLLLGLWGFFLCLFHWLVGGFGFLGFGFFFLP